MVDRKRLISLLCHSRAVDEFPLSAERAALLDDAGQSIDFEELMTQAQLDERVWCDYCCEAIPEALLTPRERYQADYAEYRACVLSFTVPGPTGKPLRDLLAEVGVPEITIARAVRALRKMPAAEEQLVAVAEIPAAINALEEMELPAAVPAQAPEFDAAIRALAMLAKAAPTVKVKEIADAVGVTDKYLYAHKIFGPAWKVFKDARRSTGRIRRGRKSKDGTIEATDEVEPGDV